MQKVCCIVSREGTRNQERRKRWREAYEDFIGEAGSLADIVQTVRQSVPYGRP